MYTFDGTNKLVILDTPLVSGVGTLDLRDMYSRWVDWLVESAGSKYLLSFSAVGGEGIDLVAGTYIPLYFFLINGWRIRPKEANHTLKVTNGILLVDGGGDPFVSTVGTFQVRINYQQPVQAIGYATGGGGGGSAPTATQVAQAVWGDTETYSVGSKGNKVGNIEEIIEDKLIALG